MAQTQVSSPVFTPASCDFSSPMTVEISAEGDNAVYYSTDGSTPTVSEKYKYNGAFVISSTTTVYAIAADADGNVSQVVSAKYTCTRHGIGEGYNPSSPGNPGSSEEEIQEKTYRLTVVANPSGAGSVYSSSNNLKAGARTRVYAYNKGDFVFKNWTIEGVEVSSTSSFYYVMPKYDVTIVANYDYNPTSPGNPSPEEQKVKHPVVVRSIPSIAASMSPSGTFDMEENSSRQVYAYPNTGWKLIGWTINGEQQSQVSSPLSVSMGEKALDIAAYFSYEPSSPSNPGANYYNPTTGQVIVDDFASGNLYNALSNLVGYGNFSNISSLIVKGQITSNDLGNLSSLSNAETIDLSRTGGIASIPSYTFESSGASSIALPSTITSIGSSAFYRCVNLTSLTVYAQEPPTCNSSTFSNFTNKENCTVYVPESAIELYTSAEYWKDFTILPITNDAHVLQVNLPENASDGRYKYNSLEIVNINSGVRQKYVISDRMLYTFNGLQKDERYNIYMFSQTGLELGRIENVVIPNQDIEISFDNLKSLHTVFAKVIASDGSDVTSQVTVEWFDPLADGTMTYLRRATSLGEIPEGQQLICRISLDNTLGVAYLTPADREFTVTDESNICTINLTPFRSVELSGVVVDGDGIALPDASVSVTQMLNGKYTKTYVAKTDRKGQWSMSVLDAPETHLIYAAAECVNVNETIGAFEENVDAMDLGKATMKSIVGARVKYGFTYRAAGAEESESYYSDYQNVAVSVYNVTQNRAHEQISLQYPEIAVLDENINEGDQLKLIATSKTGAFNPIERIVTVGENQRAEVTFEIVGKGGISAMFEMTDNPAVIAMLYSDKGELLKKVTYSEAKAAFTELEDGEYTLVSMGQSDLMNSILRLSNFSEIGLTEGKDYVKNSVKVESGKLADVKIPEVPAFDESLFYYTNSATSFSVNKSSITTGNYLTLRSAIDFKGVYKDDISNVALVVDLPEACDFVEQSVIQGPNKIPYTVEGNRLIIQLNDNYRSQTRFCVIPQSGGNFNATAMVSFKYAGKTILQPIGSAAAQIKDLDIEAPSMVSVDNFVAKGVGPAGSKIRIIDGQNNTIGSGTIDNTGMWTVKCTLNNPLNLKTISFYGEITTPENVLIRTATKRVKYNLNVILPVKVQAISPEDISEGEVVFDFEKVPESPLFYTITASDGGRLTMLVYLNTDKPDNVKNMILYIHRHDGNVHELYPQYNETKKCWVADYEIDMQNVPVNVSLDYDIVNTDVKADLREYKENYESLQDMIREYAEDTQKIEDFFANDADYTEAQLTELWASLGLPEDEPVYSDLPSDINTWPEEEIERYVQNLFDEAEQPDAELDNMLNSFDFIEENGTVAYPDGSILTISTCEGLTEEMLLQQGYQNIPNIQGARVFYKQDGASLELVDFDNDKYLLFTTAIQQAEVKGFKSSRAAPNLLAVFYEVLNKILTIRDTFNQISGYEPSRPEEILDAANTIIGEFVEAIGQCDRELDRLLLTPWQKQWKKAKELRGEKAKWENLKPLIRDKKSMEKCEKLIKDIDKQLAKVNKASKFYKDAAKFIKKCIPIVDWFALGTDMTMKGSEIKNILTSIPDQGCNEADMEIIRQYRTMTGVLAIEWVGYGAYSIGSDIIPDAQIVGGAIAGLFSGGTSFAVSAIGIAVKVLTAIGGMVWDNALEGHISSLASEVSALKFDCDDEPNIPDVPNIPKPKPRGKTGKYVSCTPDARVHIDPSGFVYEAVPTNRVEGVQASIYYKETKEDMYGDPEEEIILWNAEEYAQKNPLFTDENGMYRWDVPQGLWQVKFEKDGYQTAYSEWLPVPPPQLEVNIGIVQNKQPEVTEARAYEEGVEIQFDKFMDLSTLTIDNIYVTANGEKLAGEIRLIDSALADEYASEDDADAVRYASRVRFVPEEKLSATTGKIRVTVSRNVLSYAGIPMTETFSQELDVEKEVQTVYADDVKVLYGGEKEVAVYAMPYDAAVGRKLHVANSSDLIASIDVTEAILDDEGKAVVTVKGDLPGRAQLTFTIDDVTTTGECAVDVVTEIITAEAPKASRASGTAVYRGSKVELTTDAKNATIYFTTDGSCPCDENGTRRKYTVPIIIDDDTRILAMTSVGTNDEDVSEVVEFNYTLKHTDMDFQLEKGWTWISHNLAGAVAPSELADDEGIFRMQGQTKELIRDPQMGMVGALTELLANESYKIETTSATTRKRLSDIAWNPATPIALKSGWNWLGYPVGQTMSVNEAFATTKAEMLDVVVGQNGFAQFDGENWIGTLGTMSPGMGYMYQSQSEKNVIYNTSIVSTASAMHAFRISDKSPLVLDIHKYGSIMPVIATINAADDSHLNNKDYQVAAFCGTECRGIGRVVNGLVMMNVYGNVNDRITFQVTDAEGISDFSNSASLNFRETVIGSIFNPYAISIDNATGIANVNYNGGVKVYVEDGMLRVKGIAASDINLVEVYDINGQKLISRSHVSESGISISTLIGGVYVVIVNGKGEYTYHKIVVQ